MNQSKIYSLVTADWVKGLLMAVLGGVLGTVEQMISTGGISSIDWTAVGNLAVVSAIGYLTKQYFTNPEKGTVFGIKI